MNSSAGIFWIVFVAALLSASLAVAEVSASEPYLSVRKILSVQDRLSQGDTSVLKMQKSLQAEASKFFETLPNNVWKKSRNASAAALFMITGGSAVTFRSLLGRGVDFGENASFVKGAIAYRERNMEEAEKQFLRVDVRTLNRVSAACLYLVRAILKTSNDPKKVVRDYTMVGALIPGGYLEDTAIRLQTAAALADKKNDDFLANISVYLRRFHRSLYAQTFLKNVAEAIISLNVDDSSSVAEKQIKAFENVNEEVRISFFLSVAEAAFRSGKLNSALAFALAANSIGSSDPKLAIASELYVAAASVFSETILARKVAAKYRLRKNNLRSDVGEFADAIAAVVQNVHAPVFVDQGHKFSHSAASLEARKLVSWSQDLLSIERVAQK